MMYRLLLNSVSLVVVGIGEKKRWMSPPANERLYDLPRAMAKHDNLCAVLVHY